MKNLWIYYFKHNDFDLKLFAKECLFGNQFKNREIKNAKIFQDAEQLYATANFHSKFKDDNNIEQINILFFEFDTFWNEKLKNAMKNLIEISHKQAKSISKESIDELSNKELEELLSIIELKCNNFYSYLGDCKKVSVKF